MSAHATMTADSRPFTLRKVRIEERDRLRELLRDAVLATGPQHYSSAQVATWSRSIDDVDVWDTWMREGSGWVAVAACDPARAIGIALRRPKEHVHLLYVDPAFHRRGIARALLARVEAEAREECITGMTTDASLISHPVFLDAGYEVVAREEHPHGGEVFRRARMRKVLR